jgi:hypothetical protein
MVSSSTLHRDVDFASRYEASWFPTLRAHAAWWRASSLMFDLENLIRLRKDCMTANVRFGEPFEIVSYFSVGFITCIEWHARARLVDLMVFRPSCIDPSDVKNIDKVALSQMMSEKITVPYLLGAATKVSSIQQYIEIFNRIFKELEINVDVEKRIRVEKIEPIEGLRIKDNSLFGLLNYLFSYRHHLVHEIDSSMLNHFSVRDMWSFEMALAYGNVVLSCIKLIESEITRLAPPGFPNRLNEHGLPEDENAKILEDIVNLEAELSAMLAAYDKWPEALKASQISRENENAFLDGATFLNPIKYLDARSGLQREHLRSRLNYLVRLKSECDHWGGQFAVCRKAEQ